MPDMPAGLAQLLGLSGGGPAAADASKSFDQQLAAHFGPDVKSRPVVSATFETMERPNIQVGVDDWLSAPGRSHTLVGVVSGAFGPVSLSILVAPPRGGPLGPQGPQPGPVVWDDLPIDVERTQPCVHAGLYLVSEGEQRWALLVRAPSEVGFERGMHVDVMAADRAGAERVLAAIRAGMRRLDVYRGRVISLAPAVGPFGGGPKVEFHRLPPIERAAIVLPDGLLERVERHVVAPARHSARLRAAGQHLKRGILLHGPPGTGKTLTAMHLAGRMDDRTVILLAGHGQGMLAPAVRVARALAPALVVIEDVDLIGEQRESETRSSCGSYLFELLNLMDGLAEDADVVFLLTTNRPEALEPALAARPGRVDLAVEVPRPDAACRRRLLELYGAGLDLKGDLDAVVARTDGASAAFMRELVRKAAVLAADADAGEGRIVVRDAQLEAALRELLVTGGALGRSLLGG
jgi:hypothetical protein